MKKEFQREIKSPFSYQFETPEEGFYSLTLKASCKPGWRNRWWLWFKGLLEDILDLHLDDEDLRVEIDGIVFRKPKSQKGLFNSPAAFSGTKTLGKIKTVVFILYLTKGTHTINFIPDGSPYLESIGISKLNSPQGFVFHLNAKAEDENYYSWYTFTLVDLPLKSLSLTAQAGIKEEGADDDDLKVIINGDLQENPNSKHKHSYFCGFALRGKEDTFTKELNLEKDTHYIEFLADETPFLKSIQLALEEEGLLKARVALYKDLVSGETAQIRKGPEQKPENILSSLKEGEEVEILEKEIVGEYVVNLGYIWHKVRYKGMVGFIHSGLIELPGQSRTEMIEKIRITAKKYTVDENAVTALAGCESHFKVYATSKTWAKGIYQITSPAREEIERVYRRKVGNLFNPGENVEAGILYYKLLWERHYKGKNQALEKTVAAYNAGQGFVPPDLPLDYSRIPKENNQREQAKNLVACVLENKEKENWSFIKWSSFLLFFLVLSSTVLFSSVKLSQTFNKKPAVLSAGIFRDSEFILEDIDSDLYFHLREKWQKEGGFKTLVKITNRAGEVLEEETLIGGLMNAYLYKHYLSAFPLLVVETGVGANGVLTFIYRYDERGKLSLIPQTIEGESIEEPFGERVFLYDKSDDGDSRLKLYLFYRTFSQPLCRDSVRIDYAYEKGVFSKIKEKRIDNCEKL